jgi:hypothetical protein
MSVDGFSTTNIYFVSALMFAFGKEVLTKIEFVEGNGNTNRRHPNNLFTLDVPSVDAELYWEDWQRGKFAISDLKTYVGIFSDVTKTIRDMNWRGNPVWTQPWEIVPKNLKGRK